MQINPHARLTVDDYNETIQADMTNRVLEAHQDGLTEWYGYGTIAGLNARATYYTTPGDSELVGDVGGDFGVIDWDKRLSHIDIITDDYVVIVTIDNPDYTVDD